MFSIYLSNDLLLIVMIQKKVQVTKSKPFTICGKVVSRASDLARHMKIHCSDVKKLVLLPQCLITRLS